MMKALRPFAYLLVAGCLLLAARVAPADEAAAEPADQPAQAKPQDTAAAEAARKEAEKARKEAEKKKREEERRQRRQAHQKAMGERQKRLAEWVREGTAAGHQGDTYDNRDGGHSPLDLRYFPDLEKTEYPTKKAGWGVMGQVRPGPTVGNSSTSTSDPRIGSNGRALYSSKAGLLVAHRQYRANNLYIYPEHRDHDPKHGDLLPTNTPYLLISQGSSGSDKVFMEAALWAMGSFSPELKRELINNGLLMPTVQYLLRWTAKNVKQDEATYLSGEAHPTVFDGKQVDADAMMALAHELEAARVPPVVALKVTDETANRPGQTYFDPHPEALADTPGAIARIWRGPQYERFIEVSAVGSFDLTGQPMSYRWVLLRGDPELVDLEPMGYRQSNCRITLRYHGERKIRYGAKLKSARIDIGCFVSNGQSWSVPGFITVYALPEEQRTYEDGRIVEIDYRNPHKHPIDVRLRFPKDWRDVYKYLPNGELAGWNRFYGKDGQRQEPYSRHGFIITEKDELGRPVLGHVPNYQVSAPNKQVLNARILVQPAKDNQVRVVYASAEDFVGKAETVNGAAPPKPAPPPE